MVAKVITIAHNYQHPIVHQIVRQNNGIIGGTTGICRAGRELCGKNNRTAVVCSVAFMIEDFITSSNGTVKALTPVARIKNGEYYTPRCPMIKEQKISRATLKPKVIEDAAKKYPDAPIGVNINNCVAIKSREEISFIFNATKAIHVLEKIAKSKESDVAVLVGNTNVNLYVKKIIEPKFPDFKIVSVPDDLQCPPHLQIALGDIILPWEDAVSKYGKENVGVVAHAENDLYLTDWILNAGGQISGSGGMFSTIKNSEKQAFIVATEEGLPERIRNEIPGKTIMSPNVLCPNMKFIGRENGWWVKNAIKLAKNGEEVAGRLIVKNSTYPYYEFEYVGGGKVIEKGDNNLILGPCEIVVDPKFIDGAAKSLETLFQ
ncbi:MAG: quinolinate synthase NadA [Candidatus Bathyarchaeota archaeon]|nr:MAG: quinolinate synthase NadA [Candidatus Bathyarchaeota archaeon]